MSRIGKETIDEIIRVLKEEFEYVDQHGDHQWVMAVAIKQRTDNEYLARTVIKTNQGPYVDGTDIIVNIKADGKAELDLGFTEEEPGFHGGEIQDSIRWIEEIAHYTFFQGEDPFKDEGNIKENKKPDDQMLINSHQEEIYLKLLSYALGEYSFRNLGEYNCFENHIRNINNLYKGLLLESLLVEDIFVDGLQSEEIPYEYKLQIKIGGREYILEPHPSFTKDDIFEEIRTKIILPMLKSNGSK